jgi:FHA domain
VATCPAGHESADDEFCDVCGVLIGAQPSLVPQPPPGNGRRTESQGAGPQAAGGEPCPRCGTLRSGRFCEGCGHDFTAAPSPAAAPAPPTVITSTAGSPVPVVPSTDETRWAVVVAADRAYFESLVKAADGPDVASVSFPAYCPQRRFPLSGDEVRIGRRSARSGIEPEIDLTGPPADPGVSRLHAVLLRGADGGWAVLDPGSANGTLVNGTEIPLDQAVPLRVGDRIHLGAWTVISILRED